jgi:hypothetical protein
MYAQHVRLDGQVVVLGDSKWQAIRRRLKLSGG